MRDVLYCGRTEIRHGAHAGAHLHLGRQLGELEVATARAFARIHRNALVARQAIRALEKHHDAEEREGWSGRARDRGGRCAVSRRQLAAVRERWALRNRRPTRVAQARSDAVDADVDAALHALVGLAFAVAPHQLHLQVVQRVDVGKAVAMDRCQAALWQALFSPVIWPGPWRCGAIRPGRQDAFCAAARRAPVRHNAAKARSLLASTMSMLDSSVLKKGHCAPSSAASASAPFVARPSADELLHGEPKPNQPGSVRRHWPPAEAPGMARRSSMLGPLREAGREPMLSSAISRMGVALKK